jgi:hypothetical protein
MSLSLADVERLAAQVATEEDSALEVLAATNAEGASDYTEILLTLNRPSDPSPLVVGVSRNAGEAEIRELLRDRLRQHLQLQG